MDIFDLKKLLEEEMKNILSSDFSITITDTSTVPSITDSDITFPNLDTKSQKAKRIETCILYIDIRKSTELNLSHKPITLTRLYSSFVRSMAKAAEFYGGKVRNIIGDRLMVVFDRENCYKNAVNTAILLNSLATRILNKHFKNNEVKCGIGIDYGKMLVSKAGIRKNGADNTPYKSLVWLGRPANIASKLTDLANKTIINEISYQYPYIVEGYYYRRLKEWGWYDVEIEQFLNKNLKKELETRTEQYDYRPVYRHSDDNFQTFFLNTKTKSESSSIETSPILMTKEVYDGFVRENPDADSIKNGWWKKQDDSLLEGYDIYGGDVYFKAFD
ncbi:adenylate/guanylate cyclase domain-containing protein [Oceanobacillus caeni]|uniref:adenylate/guanylate cyclase domain-containing protein n=1 Tax=Oceanobacillus caeni TaxID=405946 RepID=UPI00195ACC70|nr:adenylate/guanylate cyclase domain-containing protein [Oceanobacillus caeni]MBU8791364.1 adenylate/guanylate cyclase domain-containing protein [Oceanobacillus caeni]